MAWSSCSWLPRSPSWSTAVDGQGDRSLPSHKVKSNDANSEEIRCIVGVHPRGWGKDHVFYLLCRSSARLPALSASCDPPSVFIRLRRSAISRPGNAPGFGAKHLSSRSFQSTLHHLQLSADVRLPVDNRSETLRVRRGVLLRTDHFRALRLGGSRLPGAHRLLANPRSDCSIERGVGPPGI